VAASQAEGQVEILGGYNYVASRRDDHTLVGDHERPIELGQLLRSRGCQISASTACDIPVPLPFSPKVCLPSMGDQTAAMESALG
jgi:hypothetical protein